MNTKYPRDYKIALNIAEVLELTVLLKAEIKRVNGRLDHFKSMTPRDPQLIEMFNNDLLTLVSALTKLKDRGE